MTEDSSENRYNIFCDECGYEISNEFIKKNKNQNKPLYCELCGAQVNFQLSKKEGISKREKKREIRTPPEENEVRFSYTTEELRQEIKNYVYQKIYELLKTTPFVIRRLKQQKDLKHSQKIKLAKKLRRILLSTSLPVHDLEQLTKISQKKIKNYFDNFKSGLKSKGRFQPKIHPLIIKSIAFIYRLINRDFELSTLSRDNQKAVKNLLHIQGFEINIKTKKSFSYQLSLFICRQIYKKITTQGHISELIPYRNQLPKHYILNIAKDMTALILNNLLRRRFSRPYRTLKKNLELDWVYRESLINHISSLVNIVYKLTYRIRDKSKLSGFERLIAEDLKRSKFFENDEYLTPEFKLNITLILCRIIYKIIESHKNLNSQGQKLNILNKNKMINIILEEILAGNEIKTEFLKKFYKLLLEEFQKEYDKFQDKMKIDIIYKENFRIYLFQLIKIVNRITQSRSKKSKHTKIELAIIKDLSNYNFIWDKNQIDPRECFIRKEEKKSFDLDTNNQSIHTNTIDKQNLSKINENKSNNNEKKINSLKVFSKEFRYDENFRSILEDVLKIVISSLPFSEKESDDTLQKSLKLYDLALRNGLKPTDMVSSRKVADLSIILVYYTLISSGIKEIDNKKITARMIGQFLGDKSIEIGLTKSGLKNLSPGNLFPFISEELKISINEIKQPSMIQSYDNNFKKDLKKDINIIILKLPFSEIERNNIRQEALRLFDYALKHGLKPSDMGINKSANFLSIILLYYALISLGVRKIKNEKVSRNVICRLLGEEDYNKIGLSKGSRTNIHTSYFKPFLPENIKTLISKKAHPHQLLYDDIKNYIESLGYSLLTNKEKFYINKRKEKKSPSQTKIKVRCENGHEWFTKYGNLWVKKGCRVCKGLSIQTYEDIKEFVKSLGGILMISKEKFENRRRQESTIPTRTKITVKCENEHIWETTKDRLMNHWCPECVGFKPWSYEDIKSYIQKLGGTILSDKEEFEQNKKIERTIPVKTRIRVRCNKGHEWETTKDRLRVSWCPKCKEGKYEKICRWYFNKIFTFVCGKSVNFTKIRLHRIIKLIKRPEIFKGIHLNKMHFDGYTLIHIDDKVIKLAFEYNGPQHYDFPNHIHENSEKGYKKFEKQQLVDNFKRWICKNKENNIVLIEFPYYIDQEMNHPKRIQKYIIKQFVNKTKINLKNNIIQFSHSI